MRIKGLIDLNEATNAERKFFGFTYARLGAELLLR